MAVIPFMNSTHTKPYLECPECGEIVISLKERAHMTEATSYTCPYCKCRYRVPIGCQILQKGVASVITIVPLILWYTWLRPSKPGGQPLDVWDVVVTILSVIPYMRLMYFVGEKLAYTVPLEKV